MGLPLINGDFVHLALARLIQGEDLETVLADLSAKYREAVSSRGVDAQNDFDDTFLINEQLCLLEGLVRAWDRIRKPAILDEFFVIDVEKQHRIHLADDIVQNIRFDLVLRRKRDGRLFVKDYKTMGAVYDGDGGKKYEHDSQILSYTFAAEQIYKERIGGLLMEGLIKGRRAKDKSTTSPFYDQFIQQSPLCYAYKVPIVKGYNDFVYEKSWSRGAEKAPVWEMKGGVEHWLATEFSDLDLQELFIVNNPFRPVQRDIDRWVRQAVAQERDVRHAHETLDALEGDDHLDALDVLFPQNHAHCFRYFNHPCAMERLCFTEEIEADPLGSGLYQKRIPHHPEGDV